MRKRTAPKKQKPALRLYQPATPPDDLDALPADNAGGAVPEAGDTSAAPAEDRPAGGGDGGGDEATPKKTDDHTSNTTPPGKVQSAAAAAKLKEKIGAERKKIEKEEQSKAKNDAAIVRSQVRIGGWLVELQKHIRKTWTNDVKAMGYHPRVARRLQKLGASWWCAENGLHESVPVEKLPIDLCKLEWLCRLNEEQLRELLGQQDCKGLPRPKVSRAVKAMLGIQTRKANTAPQAAVVNAVERFVQRLSARITELRQEGLAPQAREQVVVALDDGFAQFRRALSGGPEVAAGAGGEDWDGGGATA
jgi:hypothetical protein